MMLTKCGRGKTMRILIAYDGSQPAKNAIESLKLGGFPETDVRARVLSIEEPHHAVAPAINIDPNLAIVSYALERQQEAVEIAEETAEHVAEEGKQLLERIFPQWNIGPCSRVESPAASILEMEEAWKPDLIVMGSRGRSAVQRLILGSVSLRVLREARASVRITRNVSETDASYPPVLLLAYDASTGANKAVRELLRRPWPHHTQLHIVSVIDASILSTRNYLWLVGSDLEQYQGMNETRIERSVHDLERAMRAHFDVTSSIGVGTPVHEILNEAKRVQADTIFMGSRGLTRLERMLLGSVVQDVAAHAETTVEIVR